MKRYRTVSMFSGGFGLDLGLEATGRFETAAAVETNTPACDTIETNRDAGRTATRDLRLYRGSVLDVDPSVVMADLGLRRGELDLLTGGPPCQSFSTTGRRRGVQDPRGTLLWRMIDYLDAFAPRAFVIENVRGLVSAALRHRPIAERPDKGGPPLSEDEMPGSVLRSFLSDVRDRLGADYRLDIFEVNAVNYGAPQIRERVLIVGNRLGRVVDFPEPTHGPGGHAHSTLGDAIRDLDEPEPVLVDFSARKKRFLSLVPEGANWRSLPEDVQRESMGRAWFATGGRSGWWRRLSHDLPCPTIVTAPNHASTSLCHPTEVRALSVGECAAVQGFPRDWRFSGSPMQQYAQVGNAVPCRLGEVVGGVVADLLDGHGGRPVSEGDEMARLVHVRSHVRTRRWFDGGAGVVRPAEATIGVA